MGGLMEMTLASAGKATLAGPAGASAGLGEGFCWPGNLEAGANLPPAGAAIPGGIVPPRTLRMSPRLLKSVLRGSMGRGGNLTPPGFSAGLGPGFGGN